MKRVFQLRFVILGLTILVCLAVLHLFTGFGVRYTKTEPKESDLIGIYRPDLKTRMLMKESGNGAFASGSINVGAGNRIALVNAWRWFNDGDTNDAEISGVDLSNGVWHVEKSDSGWYIASEYKKANGLIDVPNMMIDLRLVGEQSPYKIQIYNWQTGAPYYFVQGTN